MMSISMTRIALLTIVSAAVVVGTSTSDARQVLAAEPSPPVDTVDSASILSGPERIVPAQGTAGVTNAFPFRPYNLPGEFIDDANGGVIVGEKFFDAYAND